MKISLHIDPGNSFEGAQTLRRRREAEQPGSPRPPNIQEKKAGFLFNRSGMLVPPPLAQIGGEALERWTGGKLGGFCVGVIPMGVRSGGGGGGEWIPLLAPGLAKVHPPKPI